MEINFIPHEGGWPIASCFEFEDDGYEYSIYAYGWANIDEPKISMVGYKERKKEGKKMKDEGLKLLPPKSNLCQECATKHHINEPHNKDSLYYQMHFKIKYGRFPNWEDAMAHCNEGTKQLWRKELIKSEVIPSG